MSQLAALTFANPDWLWPGVAIAALGVVLSFASARLSPSSLAKWACPALRAAGLAALVFCLLEPMWSGQRARPGANTFAVLADNSQGMQLKDAGEETSRAQRLQALLESPASGWQRTLEDNFELRRYFFDARLHAAPSFDAMGFEGRASAIGVALRGISERLRHQSLAGILLLTDGNATDLRNAADLKDLPPVYPVIIGKNAPAKDIALQQARYTESDFEDTPITVHADVTATGYAGDTITARLLDASGKQVAEQHQATHSGQESLAFRFQFRPEKPGLAFYRIQVGERRELASGKPESKEATQANNSRVLAVNRRNGPYRILYVSGRPNWEFKFLNRALDEDDQLELVGLIRVARREPRFNFIGRSGETSNPLFRGFANQSPEEVERYDQPVLVRLNTKDEAELHAGFPRTPEELYGFHAVIVDDLEAEFFAPDQASLLQKFVSERGGGFLMLGGMESFDRGKYQRTPVGDMLPVYLERTEEAPPSPSTAWRMNLTREGLLQAWARLRDTEADEKARLGAMPEFQVFNRAREVKPGAMVIANASDPAGKLYPALVVQRFGSGRTGALLIGDLWRWGLRDADSHRDMDKAWRQLIRWLVTEVPNRVEVAVQPQPDSPVQAMTIEVRVRDEKFQPLDDARVSLEVQPTMIAQADAALTNVVRLPAEPSPQELGLYTASYVPRTPGGYRVAASATNSLGAQLGLAMAGWSAEPDAEEFRSLQPNFALMEDIARRTGGEVVSADTLAKFARSLPTRQAPVMEAWSYPLWHTPTVFVLGLCCFFAEWGLRRWKGLP